MKKLIFIFILLLTISCSHFVVKNVFDRTYSTSQNDVYNDVYNQLNRYGVDSIPLENWITNQMISDTSIILQRMIRQDIDEETNYLFILTEYKSPNNSFYKFVVRYSGKK